mgnify:CR=1 FL=1
MLGETRRNKKKDANKLRGILHAECYSVGDGCRKKLLRNEGAGKNFMKGKRNRRKFDLKQDINALKTNLQGF